MENKLLVRLNMLKKSLLGACAAVLIGLTLPATAQVRSDSQVTTTLVVPPLTLPGQQEDADKVVCRRPQELPGKRLFGPEVCKPQRQ